MYCPHCGFPNSGVEEVCPDCGKSLTSSGPVMSSGKPPGPAYRSKTGQNSKQRKELGVSKLGAGEKLSWSQKKLK